MKSPAVFSALKAQKRSRSKNSTTAQADSAAHHDRQSFVKTASTKLKQLFSLNRGNSGKSTPTQTPQQGELTHES